MPTNLADDRLDTEETDGCTRGDELFKLHRHLPPAEPITMASADTSHKDPIADAQLRDAGQSLRESIQARSLDTVVPWLAVAVLGFTIALLWGSPAHGRARIETTTST